MEPIFLLLLRADMGGTFCPSSSSSRSGRVTSSNPLLAPPPDAKPAPSLPSTPTPPSSGQQASSNCPGRAGGGRSSSKNTPNSPCRWVWPFRSDDISTFSCWKDRGHKKSSSTVMPVMPLLRNEIVKGMYDSKQRTSTWKKRFLAHLFTTQSRRSH